MPHKSSAPDVPGSRLVRRVRPGAALDRVAPEVPRARLLSWDGSAAPESLRTEARVAHDGELLIVEFEARFDELNVDPGPPLDRAAPGLWEHDVVEVFVSSQASGVPYFELEASPLGQWLALAFDAPRRAALPICQARPKVTATLAPPELHLRVAIELAQIGVSARPGSTLRLGLFRIHGRKPHRQHLALAATRTAAPDFHQPESWPHWELEA